MEETFLFTMKQGWSTFQMQKQQSNWHQNKCAAKEFLEFSRQNGISLFRKVKCTSWLENNFQMLLKCNRMKSFLFEAIIIKIKQYFPCIRLKHTQKKSAVLWNSLKLNMRLHHVEKPSCVMTSHNCKYPKTSINSTHLSIWMFDQNSNCPRP